MKFRLTLSDDIRQHCPLYRGAAVYASVQNSAHSDGLWEEIAAFTRELQASETPDSIKLQPAIAATRAAYKALGKDPSRYRPSNEALVRRTLQGLSLIHI